MGLTRRKANIEWATEDRLAAARAEQARIEAAIAESGRDRDLALLDDDADAVRRAESTAAELGKERERATRRIALLEEKTAAELRARQEKAREDRLAAAEKKFNERDRMVADLAEHLQAAVVVFRKAISLGAEGAAGFPFGPADSMAALIGNSFVRAVSHELYRLSGSPFQATGQRGDWQFPGSECPTPASNTKPDSVVPLVEQVALATRYALEKMRAEPTRLLPIVSPVVPQPAPPAPSPAQQTVTADAPPPQAEPERIAEYAFFVDLINARTGERRTERIVLGPDEVSEAYLDGIGPVGPRGRDIAIRLAGAHAATGFIFDGRRESLRFDLPALSRSLGE